MADDHPLLATDQEVLATAASEVQRFKELSHRAHAGYDVPESIKGGCSIELGHRGLTRLPSELINIIKDDADRLALDRNRLTSLSGLAPRFAECTRLRYLVMRNNSLREFPSSILLVPTIEVLDLRGNKIEKLPEDLSRLHNLKTFSIRQNKVSKLPLCIGAMNNLICLTTGKNPITFPPLEEWAVTHMAPRSDEDERSRDILRDREETQRLKRVLQEYQSKERHRNDTDGETTEDNLDTPRPTRRKISGRFPLKLSGGGGDIAGLATPTFTPLISKPPIPSRSHARAPIPPQSAIVRPTLMTQGLSERNRSSSESQMSMAGNPRLKRMGMAIPRQRLDTGRLDPAAASQLQHARGLSHGSATYNGGVVSNSIADAVSPISPVDGDLVRPFLGRRLSTLTEDKRKSRPNDPYIDLARGVSFAMSQMQAPIKNLVRLTSDGKRSNLESICHNAFAFLDELDRQLNKLERVSEEGENNERRRSVVSVQASCETSLRLFCELVAGLQLHVKTLVQQGNPRYVRSLMHLLYAGLVEIRNAYTKVGVEFQATPKPVQRELSRGRYAPATPRRPSTSFRMRDPSATQNSSRSNSRQRPPLPVTSFPSVSMSRSASMTSLPGSGRQTDMLLGFAPSTRTTRSNTLQSLQSVDELEEGEQFESIFKQLFEACEAASYALPKCSVLFSALREGSVGNNANLLGGICERCNLANDAADALTTRLGSLNIQAQDPSTRSHPEFWQLCTAFTRAFYVFAAGLKEISPLIPPNLMADEIKPLLKPVQKLVKDVSRLINDSAWGHLAVQKDQAFTHPAQPNGSLAVMQPRNGINYAAGPAESGGAAAGGGASTGYVTPLPATPLSAALGPAALATVPVIPAVPPLPTSAMGYHANGVGLDRSRSASRRRM